MTMQQKEGSSFGQKLLKFLLVVLPIAIAIWLFSIATEARAIAQSNSELLREPVFQLSLIPGGPGRFADPFAGAVEDAFGDGSAFSLTEEDDAAAEAFDPTQYLWVTLIIRNIGERDADDVRLEIEAMTAIDHLLIAPSGWNNQADVEMGETANTATAAFSYLDQGEETLVFIGTHPQAFEAPYDRQAHRAWAEDFLLYFDRFLVESDRAQDSLYGYGYEPMAAETAG